jgi:hypothetical protein
VKLLARNHAQYPLFSQHSSDSIKVEKLMSQHDESYVQLADFLREKGHTEPEVEKILAKVKLYEDKTSMYSIMDSIGAGSLNLGKIIDEALASE